MTKDRYFEMCEQLGKEPDPEEMPPDLNDFPDIVQIGMLIFNALGDRVYPDIGYIGKDYTNLPILMEMYGVEDPELLIEVLGILDARAIEKSSESLKREREKLKRQSNGPKRSHS